MNDKRKAQEENSRDERSGRYKKGIPAIETKRVVRKGEDERIRKGGRHGWKVKFPVRTGENTDSRMSNRTIATAQSTMCVK